MRLCSYRESGGDERLAVVVGDRALPAADLAPGGPRTIVELLAGGQRALDALRERASEDRFRRDGRPLEELQLLAGAIEFGRLMFAANALQDVARVAAREGSQTTLGAGC